MKKKKKQERRKGLNKTMRFGLCCTVTAKYALKYIKGKY
jgi:hypothetical protein